MKYLKLFETTAEYEAFISADFDKPNVSYCEDNNEVHYNPLTKPNNIITYEASAKLAETTSDKDSGLHTNKFGTTMVSHNFENGVGTIEFEDAIITIGSYAFYGCAILTSVTIPDSVTSIGSYAFQNCSGLTSATICDSVETIGNSAFYGCSSLTSVTIPDSVTSIGDGVFAGCTGLTSVTIPDSVTSIGDSAFNNCIRLTSITIPNSVTSISNYAFSNCSGLTSVTIPNSVTSISYWAFSNCTGLTSITVEATTPPTLGSGAFNNTNNCPIYVPAASVETYKAATSGWSSYASRIQAIPTT